MDPQTLLLEAVQHYTRGRILGVVCPSLLRGYVLLRRPNVSWEDLDTAIRANTPLLWHAVGSMLQLTPLGNIRLWALFGTSGGQNPNAFNATARWFAIHWVRFSEYAAAYLSRKLPRSAELKKIQDHMMDYVLKAIERDYLAKYLVESQSVPYSMVASYTFRMAASSLRKDGRDPCCRALHGALAPHEVQARKVDDVPWTNRVEPATLPLGEDPMANLADASANAFDGGVDIERLSRLVARILERTHNGIPLFEVYKALWNDGLGIGEVARVMGTDRRTINAAKAEIRRLMLEHQDELVEMGALSTNEDEETFYVSSQSG